MHSWSLVAASALFWASWLLMPGVGVTDPERIFALVSSQRSLVMASVLLQLSSAALYIPASIGFVANPPPRRANAMRWGAGLLLAGAIGSGADAVLHLLAYAMTAPDLETAPLVPVMAFMQGPGLVMLGPFLASFFAGGALLSRTCASAGLVPSWNPRLHGLALVVAVVGGAAAGAELVSGRLVGLTALGLVAAAQAGIGLTRLSRRARTVPSRAAWAGVLAVAAVVPLGATSPAMEFLRAQEANRAALREYTWKSRTELTLAGESRQVRLDQVRYDLDGRLQRTRIGGSDPAAPPAGRGLAGAIKERIAVKRADEVRAIVHDLTALAAAYANPPLDRLHAFARTATTAHDAGTVRIHGDGVLQPGDSVTMWIEPATGTMRRVEIVTSLETKPVRVTSEYRTLPNGLTCLARSVLRYPDRDLVLTIEEFAHEHVGIGGLR